MPNHKLDKFNVGSVKGADKRVKLTPEQRIEIRDNVLGLSNHMLAKEYGVSRRLIQFIRHPERQEKNLKDREERGGWKQYYVKEDHAKTVSDHRKYKRELMKGLKT